MSAELHTLLTSCLSSDPEIRGAAEKQIYGLRRTVGFGPALLLLVQQQSLPEDSKLLASILLKQYVTEQWFQDEIEQEQYTLGVIPESDRNVIRQQILRSIADPTKAVRSNVAVTVAQIAKTDYPEAWPELMQVLMQGIKQRRDVNAIDGCVQCLNELSTELDENQVVPVFQEMEQELYSILKDGQDNDQIKEVSVQCIGILRSWIDGLHMMKGVYQEQVTASISQILPKWMEFLCSKLTNFSKDIRDINQQIECCQAVQCSVRGFAHITSTFFPKIVEICVNLIAMIASNFDSEEEGLLNLLQAILETMITFSETPSCIPVLAPRIQQIVHGCLFVCSCVDEDVIEYGQFIETDIFEQPQLRSAPAILLANLQRNSPQEFNAAFYTEIMQTIKLKLQWQVYEAAMFLVGYMYMQEQLSEEQCNLVSVLLSVLQGGAELATYPSVIARALWICTCLFPQLPGNLQEISLHAAIRFLEKGGSMLENLAACKTLTEVISSKKEECSRVDFYQVLVSVSHLLQNAPEENIPMVLTCIEHIVQSNPASVQKFGPDVILRPVAQIWEQNIGNLLIQDAVSGVVSAFLQTGMEASVSQLLSPLCNTVKNIQDQNRQESAMNLIVSIVKTGSKDLCRQVFENLSDLLLSDEFIQSTSDDLGNSAVVLLCHIIGHVGQDLLNAQNAQDVHSRLMGIVNYLLRSDVPSEKSQQVGTLIILMLRYMQNITMQYALDIIRAVAFKLGNLQNTMHIQLKEELLLVICRMLMADFNATLQVLNSVSEKAADFVFSTLTDSVLDCISKFHLNVFVSTLLQIVTTAMNNQQSIVDNVRVIVQAVDMSHLGVQTRHQKAQNKTDDNMHTEVVPLSVGASVALIRLFSQLTRESGIEDYEESEGGEDDDENEQQVNELVYRGLVDTRNLAQIWNVEQFDPNLAQDPLYALDVMKSMGDFFVRCLQQQSNSFKFALSKCSEIEREQVTNLNNENININA
eukprot:TRINITY_DN4153_c0_g3_i2.p1 TRINITY_DN4153_c0_g3~~TRINITY_DN4153_c0_g3_i2.p1  ORF type:complete len:1006 (-),score=99.68 TRINITY_DN4153_c0_g3_i2:1196-4138(-)